MPISISNTWQLLSQLEHFKAMGQLKEDSKICVKNEEYDPFYTYNAYLINGISLDGGNIILTAGSERYNSLPPKPIPSSFSIHWQWGGPGEWKGYLVSNWVNEKGENCSQEHESYVTRIVIDYRGVFIGKCCLWPTKEIASSKNLKECENLLESRLIDREDMDTIYKTVKKAEQSKTPLGEWWKISK